MRSMLRGVSYVVCVVMLFVRVFFFSSKRRHTRCALVTGVQTCALPICPFRRLWRIAAQDHLGAVRSGGDRGAGERALSLARPARYAACVARARGIARRRGRDGMRASLSQTFAIPLLLLVVTVAGLVLGLMEQGWLDMVAIVALAAPIAVLLGYLRLRR